MASTPPVPGRSRSTSTTSGAVARGAADGLVGGRRLGGDEHAFLLEQDPEGGTHEALPLRDDHTQGRVVGQVEGVPSKSPV